MVTLEGALAGRKDVRSAPTRPEFILRQSTTPTSELDNSLGEGPA